MRQVEISALRARLERLLGIKVESWRGVEGGYTPALRLLYQTALGSFFAKVGTTPLTNQMLRRESRNYELIRADFMPRLIAWEDHEEHPMLVLEDLSTAHWPPPWDEQQIALVLAQINVLHSTPAPLEPFAQVHPALGSSWQAVADEPVPFLALGCVDEHWLEVALPGLIAAENACSTEGTSLTHCDLRSDNLCLLGKR
jgi:hypothetical protein